MDSAGQLKIFLTCVLLGVAGGLLYEAVSLLALPKPKKAQKPLRFLADVIFFTAFAVVCIWTFTALRFSSFREYHYLGFAIGLILYLKTFHKAVAFFKNICYNGIKKLVNCAKKRKNFRKKEEKRL